MSDNGNDNITIINAAIPQEFMPVNSVRKEIKELCQMARAVQDKSLSEDQRKQKMLDLRVRYNDLYCVFLISGNHKEIESEYSGSLLRPGIRRFFESGWKPYAWRDRFPSIQWNVDVEKAFVERINRQFVLYRSKHVKQ